MAATKSALLLALVVAVVGACATGPNSCPKMASAGAAAIPAFPLAALHGPHAQRAKLYLDAAGRIHKVAVYVTKAGIPAWAHAAADAALGKGEDQEYEVEEYANGDQTYELTRLVAGKTVEVALDARSKQVLYTEQKGLAVDTLPAPIKAALGRLPGFSAESYTLKTPKVGAKMHEVYGKQGGQRWKVYLADDGKLLRRHRELPAKLGVGAR